MQDHTGSPQPPSHATAAALPLLAQIVRRHERDNLVCVRLGRSSAFRHWFQPDAPRNWDLMLSYYAPPDEDALFSAAETVSAGGVSKFPAIADLHSADPGLFARYRFIWFLDDDIEVAFADVDRLFEQMSGFGLSLAQPALSSDSYVNWPLTKVDPECQVRYTDFVEVMMPVFSQQAFQRCVGSFATSISGWGLDFVWPKLLGYSRKSLGIIDTVVARHTKKIDVTGGPFYQHLHGMGIEPWQEMAEVMKKFGVSGDMLPRVLGAVKRPGGITQTVPA